MLLCKGEKNDERILHSLNSEDVLYHQLNSGAQLFCDVMLHAPLLQG